MTYKKFRPQRVNTNKHTERGMALLEKSIQKDGWIGAITVAADGETFDGSARLETVGAVMGESEPIVVDVDGTRPVILRRTDIESVDDPRAKRLAVAANAIASADWNPDGPLLAALAAEDDLVAQLVKNDDKAAKAVLEHDNPVSQDELLEKYGEPSDDDFYPIIKIKVSPKIKLRFDAVMVLMPGANEMEKLDALVSRGELS